MDDQFDGRPNTPVELAADLVAAYVSNNNVPVAELSALIFNVHAALAGLGNKAEAEPAGPEKPTPAQVRKSITADALISFEDGKSYKTLRRHLTLRGLSPEAYRAKWGLAADYPMTSAAYSAHRSELARSLGLGQQRRKGAAATKAASVAETPETPGRSSKAAETPEPAPRVRGRKNVAATA